MNKSKRVVFIGGCPRSGTTMLGSLLGSAHSCLTSPESHFKQTVLKSFNMDPKTMSVDKKALFKRIKENFRFKIWEVSLPSMKLAKNIAKDDYRKLMYEIVNEYAKKVVVSDWKVWIDHTPQNIQDPLLLLSIFPEAKFVHIVRDPRAVAASVIPLDWGPDSSKEAALFWSQKISYGLALEKKYPGKCKRFYYEDIVENPEKTLKDICDFCEIEYSNDLLRRGNINLPEYTMKQHSLVGKKLNPKRLSAWQEDLNVKQIYELEVVLGDLMEIMGYQKYSHGKAIDYSAAYLLKEKLNPLSSFFKKKRHFIRKIIYGQKK